MLTQKFSYMQYRHSFLEKIIMNIHTPSIWVVLRSSIDEVIFRVERRMGKIRIKAAQLMKCCIARRHLNENVVSSSLIFSMCMLA